MMELINLKNNRRKYIPESLTVSDWETLKPYYEELVGRLITSIEDLRQWFKDRSELESVVEEDAAWRYIHMTCDTNNQQKLDRYTSL
jgi:oligoendopeptidase F